MKTLADHNHNGLITQHSLAQHFDALDGRSGVLRLDGDKSFISTPTTTNMQVDGDLSFEMWAKFHDDVTANWAVLFGDDVEFAFYKVWQHNLVLWYQSTDPVQGNESMVLPVQHDILDEEWSHIAVVVEYPRTRFYHNGNLILDSYMAIPGIESGISPLRIGLDAPLDLDEFRLYDRALTPAEVAAHAQGQDVPPGQHNEAAVETHWYDETVTVRLSAKGTDYSGHTARIRLEENGLVAAGPVAVAIDESSPGSGRYVASGAFPLAGLQDRTLDGVIEIRDSSGTFVTEVRHDNVSLAQPDWVNTTEGYSNEILAPWTPVVADTLPGGTVDVGVWGRQHEFGATPFFQQIETQQTDLLAAPMRLGASVAGSPITWDLAQTSLTSQSDLMAEVFQSLSSADGQLQVDINAVTEYDGYTIFEVTLEANQALSLSNLSLEIPLETDSATLLYGDKVFPVDHQVPINEYYSGEINGNLAFKFSPNIWVGNEEVGLTWQAESNQDWHNANDLAAIEVLPQGSTTLFRANLVDMAHAMAAGETLNYTFALLATPVKPLERDAWDLRIARSEPYGKDLDLPDSETGGIPTLQHYVDVGVRHLFINVNDIWPYPVPVHDQFSTALERLINDSHDVGLNLYPYAIHQRVPTTIPEFDIHGLHMANRPVQQYIPDNNPPGSPRPGPITIDYGADSQGTVFMSPKSQALQDAYVHALAERLDQFGDDGVYLDGTASIVADQNMLHGSGYIDDQGNIQPTYPVFAARELMRRIYIVVKQRNPNGLVDVHDSFSYNPAGLAYADNRWTGEQWFHLRSTGTDYPAGELSLDMFRTEFMGTQVGIGAETLHYRLGSEMELSAISLLHDVPVRASTNDPFFDLMTEIWAMRDQFGADQAEKFFYWENQQFVNVGQQDGYATLLKHPDNGVLALVSNLSPDAQTLDVQFNLETLHLDGGPFEVLDALTEAPIAITPDGQISLPLGSEDWTYVRIRPIRPSQVGDYNYDGIVNAADFATWRNSLGQLVYTNVGADGNGNGVIDQDDHPVWKNHFGLVLAEDQFSWNRSGGGNWNEAGNWNPTDGPPDGEVDTVFGNAIEAPSTVAIDSPVTVRSLQFTGPHAYTIAGPGGLSLDSGLASGATVDITAGSHQFQTEVTMVSDTVVNVTSGENLTFAAEINLNGQSLNLASGDVNINERVNGGGTIHNAGTLGTDGLTTIGADLTSTGTLRVDVAGAAVQEFDWFLVAGIANLSGILDVELAPGFTPTSPFTIFTASSLDAANLTLDASDVGVFSLDVVGNQLILNPLGVATGNGQEQSAVAEVPAIPVFVTPTSSEVTSANPVVNRRQNAVPHGDQLLLMASLDDTESQNRPLYRDLRTRLLHDASRLSEDSWRVIDNAFASFGAMMTRCKDHE